MIYYPTISKKYIEVLKEEIASYNIKELDTIYIGGGTPSVLSEEELENLLSFLDRYTDGVKEYSFEANPESLTYEKLLILKKHHVNRLSIGVESTNDEILKEINRHHTFNDLKEVYNLARRVGFDNISFDLILGLPGQSIELLKEDVKNLVSLKPDHLSCYSLTVHPNTVFGIRKIEEKDDDEMRQYYDYLDSELAKYGYIHYEISSWCLKGKESLHNLTYWKDEKYYGCGLSASGYIDNLRYTNTKSINLYLEKKFIDYQEEVDEASDLTYFIMLNLRTNRGIVFNEFFDRFGFSFLDYYQDEIKEMEKNHLIVSEEDNIHPTYEGMMILDQLILTFINKNSLVK